MSVVCPSEFGCVAGVASAAVLHFWAFVCTLAWSVVCCVSENGLCVFVLQWVSTVPGASDVCGKGGRGDQLERYVGGLR